MTTGREKAIPLRGGFSSKNHVHVGDLKPFSSPGVTREALEAKKSKENSGA